MRLFNSLSLFGGAACCRFRLLLPAFRGAHRSPCGAKAVACAARRRTECLASGCGRLSFTPRQGPVGLNARPSVGWFVRGHGARPLKRGLPLPPPCMPWPRPHCWEQHGHGVQGASLDLTCRYWPGAVQYSSLPAQQPAEAAWVRRQEPLAGRIYGPPPDRFDTWPEESYRAAEGGRCAPPRPRRMCRRHERAAPHLGASSGSAALCRTNVKRAACGGPKSPPPAELSALMETWGGAGGRWADRAGAALNRSPRSRGGAGATAAWALPAPPAPAPLRTLSPARQASRSGRKSLPPAAPCGASGRARTGGSPPPRPGGPGVGLLRIGHFHSRAGLWRGLPCACDMI